MEEIEEMQKMGSIWFDMVRCRFELHRNKPGFRSLVILPILTALRHGQKCNRPRLRQHLPHVELDFLSQTLSSKRSCLASCLTMSDTHF